MGQPGAQHGACCRWLLSGARRAGGGGELPGLAPSLQPEEEERRAAVGLRLSARVCRPRTRSAAAGKTTGEETAGRTETTVKHPVVHRNHQAFTNSSVLLLAGHSKL